MSSSLASAAPGVSRTNNSWSKRPSWASEIQRSNSLRPIRKQKEIRPFSPESHNIALDIGQVFLMGDLSANYSDNLGGRLNYTYGVSDIFGLHTALGYSSHSDGSFSMTSANMGLRTNLSWYDKIIPHAIFGLGFYNPSYTYNVGGGNTESLSPILFGLHLGPGVDLEINERMFFGTSLTFHSIFGSTQAAPNGSSVNVGGTYTSFLLHAGVTL